MRFRHFFRHERHLRAAFGKPIGQTSFVGFKPRDPRLIDVGQFVIGLDQLRINFCSR